MGLPCRTGRLGLDRAASRRPGSTREEAFIMAKTQKQPRSLAALPPEFCDVFSVAARLWPHMLHAGLYHHCRTQTSDVFNAIFCNKRAGQ